MFFLGGYCVCIAMHEVLVTWVTGFFCQDLLDIEDKPVHVGNEIGGLARNSGTNHEKWWFNGI